MPDFKFSLPSIASLYPDQQLAYNSRNSTLVTGGPGSGKTVVTIFRFLRPVGESKDVLLFTFNRTLIYSIRGTLRDRAEELFGRLDEEQIEKIVEEKLNTFYKWHKDNINFFDSEATDLVLGTGFQNFIANDRQNIKFDELFFDEGQDLPPSVYANVLKLTHTVSVGADKAQNYRGHYVADTVENVINNKLNTQTTAFWRYLGGNFRNSKEIFQLAQKFVPNDLRVQALTATNLRSGNNPEIEVGFRTARQLEYIKEIIEKNQNSNIGILVHFKRKVLDIKEYLEKHGYSCEEDAPVDKSFSYYISKMDQNDESIMMKKLKTPFITTFESCKGLEFDIVIMPFFEQSDYAMSNRNNDGRFFATRNHYYVAVTRARNDIFILCDNKPNVLSFYNARTNITREDLPF
ncbi:3'-5' exonuclease [Flavobacterium hydrophilum]|uniref:DNA 3'-5' helicase II n=1 Tax=Flavobacterium hydrophilum TaxID=2211445 RepID=A0A2V4C570_9FLAO|nr:3'-5' exonuclease [Flavobacterium hydrophilum]PXY46496.1 hypothetical protein DMB68_04795 [Flavobacterium hydrophilum]